VSEGATPGAPELRDVRTSKEFGLYARNRLIQSRLTPNTISMAGFVGNLAAAILILEGHFVIGAFAFIAGSVMDTLDGRYSRMSGKGTLFGAFLDSTLDRIEEGIVLTAVAWQFADAGNPEAAAACVGVVLGSLMVSYTRARAEALGVECTVGIASRPVRVVILSAGLMFAAGELIDDVDLLEASIWVMLGLTAVTTVQRIWHVRNALATSDPV
jgi:CDP-diacylglycerol--glycerol-3-phosphate 3-phosphatidyltransferase